MSDAAAMLTAIGSGGGILAIMGTGARFVWNKIEARAKASEAATEKRFKKIEDDLKACQDREHLSDRRAAIKLTAIELMWQEVDRLTPTKPNQTLQRVKRLLDSLKLPEPSMDLKLEELAAAIDRKRGKP